MGVIGGDEIDLFPDPVNLEEIRIQHYKGIRLVLKGIDKAALLLGEVGIVIVGAAGSSRQSLSRDSSAHLIASITSCLNARRSSSAPSRTLRRSSLFPRKKERSAYCSRLLESDRTRRPVSRSMVRSSARGSGWAGRFYPGDL